MTALLDVVNDDSDEDDIIQGFVWEDINKYKGQGENFTSSVRPQDAAKDVTKVVDDFQLFFNKELIDRIAEETNRYAEQFLHGCKLSSRSAVRAWKPVTEGEIYVLLGLYNYGHHLEVYSEVIFHHEKGIISTPGFGDIVTKYRLELICKFLHFIDSETVNYFQGPKKLLNIFTVILCQNKSFQELCFPNQEISRDES
jgi:hypothetical protein